MVKSTYDYTLPSTHDSDNYPWSTILQYKFSIIMYVLLVVSVVVAASDISVVVCVSVVVCDSMVVAASTVVDIGCVVAERGKKKPASLYCSSLR